MLAIGTIIANKDTKFIKKEEVMKRSVLYVLLGALLAVSCGTAGQMSTKPLFCDGIYYQPDPSEGSRETFTIDRPDSNLVIVWAYPGFYDSFYFRDYWRGPWAHWYDPFWSYHWSFTWPGWSFYDPWYWNDPWFWRDPWYWHHGWGPYYPIHPVYPGGHFGGYYGPRGSTYPQSGMRGGGAGYMRRGGSAGVYAGGGRGGSGTYGAGGYSGSSVTRNTGSVRHYNSGSTMIGGAGGRIYSSGRTTERSYNSRSGGGSYRSGSSSGSYRSGTSTGSYRSGSSSGRSYSGGSSSMSSGRSYGGGSSGAGRSGGGSRR